MKRMSHGMRVLSYGVALVVVTTVSSVLGQPADDGGGRELQGRRRDRGAWVARMVERVAQELNLDDEQNAQLNTIVAEQRERMREVRRLFRALREAEDSGDAERAEELRAQLPERPEHGWDPVRPVLDRLEPFLRPDQLDGLEALRNRPRGPRARLERLAEDLNLDAQQRVQFDEFAEAMGARFSDQRGRWRELRPLFRELREARDTGDAELVETLTAQISELRPARGTAMNEFFDNVEGILREDQIPVLQQIRSRRMERRNGRRARLGDNAALDAGARAEAGRPGAVSRADTAMPNAARATPTPSAVGGGVGRAAAAPGRSGLRALERLEAEIDFGNTLELDDEQREALARALRSARQQAVANPDARRNAVDDVLAEMRTILRDDQLKAFGTLRDQIVSGDTAERPGGDLRVVLRAARSVHLRKQQRRRLSEIHKAAAKAFKDARRDPERRAKLAADVKDEIIGMLDADQVKRFERQLKRLERRARHNRNPRRGRPD